MLGRRDNDELIFIRATDDGQLKVAVEGVGVTGFEAETNDGITSSVANPTTVPKLTLGLGDITPNSVAASGAVSGSNLSGTNTGDQTITLSGDVGGSGQTDITATIADDAVTFAKMQNISSDHVLGRATAGSGDVEELTLGNALETPGGVLNAIAYSNIFGGVTNVGGNATTLALLGALSANSGIIALAAGQIIGVFITLASARTAGTCTAQVLINGVAQTGLGQTAQIDGTNTLRAYAVFPTPISFVRGDYLQIQTVTAAFTPTAADAVLGAMVRYLA